MIKKQFTLYLENKPGVLAGLTTRLAEAKVNIEGISVAGSADVGLAQIVVSNAAKMHKILKSIPIPFTVQRVALVPLKNKPGALARIATQLARSKVNINYVYATACAGGGNCECYVIISAPDLEEVEAACAAVWQK